MSSVDSDVFPTNRREVTYDHRLRLVQWHFGDEEWVEVSGVTTNAVDRYMITRYAELASGAVLDIEGIGILIRLSVLPRALVVAGLHGLATILEARLAKSAAATSDPKGPISNPQLRRPSKKPMFPGFRFVAQALRADQVRRLYESLQLGHSINRAAKISGVDAPLARKLCRGLIPLNQLDKQARQAFERTFAQSPELMAKRGRTPDPDVDARNAKVLRDLYKFMAASSLTLAEACRLSRVNYDTAYGIFRKPPSTMAPQTLKAWQETFGRQTPDPKNDRPSETRMDAF